MSRALFLVACGLALARAFVGRAPARSRAARGGVARGGHAFGEPRAPFALSDAREAALAAALGALGVDAATRAALAARDDDAPPSAARRAFASFVRPRAATRARALAEPVEQAAARVAREVSVAKWGWDRAYSPSRARDTRARAHRATHRGGEPLGNRV